MCMKGVNTKMPVDRGKWKKETYRIRNKKK